MTSVIPGSHRLVRPGMTIRVQLTPH
ncbi:protein of unknown function [Bradyrhizobium vignae]|uniref:Uncharacterized protein n=1 Tax=Bradyrhizobium vignae TaxID=1549949 RepID=A0A2U3PZT2_9BRAD|nr:protein of unknown function [Bradyrhizobium vignae]